MSAASNILVVDDDASIRDALCEYLARHGYTVRSAKDGVEMDRHLAEREADLIVLDWMMPGEDGLSICRRLAANGAAILMLSAMGTALDRVIGLEVGADDYLAKPFDPRELLARVRALLRRRDKTDGAPAVVIAHFDGWRFDAAERRLLNPNGELVALTPLECNLLRAFVERAGRLLSRDRLMQLTHGDDADAFDRAMDLAVSRLRRKLRWPGCSDPIETVRGEGYRFNPAVERR
ncbi:response regulator [Lysobacter sp. 22409]|uniref:response regulator n=1 Tax=Lysobacter sp. 22409 TaxID=3453917 RepID=UPI003F85EDF7